MNWRTLRFWLLLFSLTPLAAAQFTTVSGTVTDPNGLAYANGTISATLIASASPTLGGQAYIPPAQRVGLSSAGSFVMQLADNTQLSPGGTQWKFQVCSSGATVQPSFGKGPVCFSVGPLTISGTAQSLTATLTAAALALTSSFSGGGGGNINPGTAASQIPTWSPTSSLWLPQPKPVYDVRDWANCNTTAGTTGGTDVTTSINAMLAVIGSQQATVRLIGTSNPTNSCLVSTISWPANVTLDFSGGGSLTLNNTLTPTGRGVVDGTPVGAFNSATNSCSVTLNVPTLGDSIFLFSTYHFASGGGLGLPSDTANNVYRLVSASNANPNYYSTNTFGWIASNVAAGSVTITVPYTASTNNTCGAFAISGLGPFVGADGTGATCGNSCSTSSPMTTSTSATYTTGSFLVSFGGQTTNTETCTAGSGFTQILNIGTNMSLCAQVQNAATGGAVTATQTISSTPTSSYWMYNSVGLKPIYPTQTILGGVVNPNNHQIFYAATGNANSQGIIDFTGATNLDKIYPEWWGAATAASSATNTAAIQAAINGAFGTGRTNSSGLAFYNRPLYFTGQYKINGELSLLNTIGFTIRCSNRLNSGITQTASNARIFNGQANAYGIFDNCGFTGSASSTLPLIDLDQASGNTPTDLKPQFIDFYNDTFAGNAQVAQGVLIAKSGGGAQGSNINFYDPEFNGFTTAALQVGSSSGFAQNALAISVYNGDFQGNPQYGFADYGGGFIQLYGTTFEDGGFNGVAQTGADIYCNAPQGPVVIYDSRSESRKFAWCDDAEIYDSRIVPAYQLPAPGSSAPVGTIVTGNKVTGDGAYYNITVDAGNYSGAGTTAAPLTASSGTSTTITDTNQTTAGSVTIGLFASGSIGETMTQATSGATATRINSPASTGTIPGVATGAFTLNETLTQAVSGAVCTEQAPSPLNGGTALSMNNCSSVPDSTHTITGGTSGSTFAPSGPIVFTATSLLMTAATGTPDSTHDWVGGTSGAHFTPTATPANEAAWTVNAFTGMQVGVQSGTDAYCKGTITSNTAQTLTFSAGYTTAYPQTICTANTDTTSTFIVEPLWNHGTVTDGGITMVYLNENVVGGSGPTLMTGRIQDSRFFGGQIAINSAGGSALRNVTVSRPDWLNTSGGNLPQPGQDTDWDVRVLINGGGGGGNPVKAAWSLPHSGGAGTYSGSLHENFGAKALCSMQGSTAGTSTGEHCILGESDPGAGSDPFRNRVEVFSGTGLAGIGPPAPTGLNQNGIDFPLMGGPSTGTGTPGSVLFKIGAVGSSGTTPNSGSTIWRVDGATGHFFAQTDNSNDIGASAANRPRNGYFGTSVSAPSGLFTSVTIDGVVITGVPSAGQTLSCASPTSCSWQTPGIVPRASVCPSNADTILSTDRGGYVSETDASACAVSLPQAGSTGFASNFFTNICNIGAGTVTLTPTTSTISYTTGSSYTAGATSMAISTGKCASIVSDNTNYFAILR